MKLLLIKWRYNILYKYRNWNCRYRTLQREINFRFSANVSNVIKEHSAIDTIVTFSRRSRRCDSWGMNLLVCICVCVCVCVLCVHGRILSWSQVFRITRGRNPWNTLDDVDERLKLRSPLDGSRRRDRRRTRRRGSRPVIGRCSCKISILIRKTATAARIVGWNRRRNRAALPGRRRRSFEPPRALCTPDGRVSAFRTQWSETNCRHYDTTGESRPRTRRHPRQTNTRAVHTYMLLCAGNRVCVCVYAHPHVSCAKLPPRCFLNFLCTYCT